MIIDGHQHVLKDKQYQKNFNIQCGVDKVILFPTVVHPEIANSKNEFTRELSTLHKILKGEINPVEARINAIDEMIQTIQLDPEYFIGFAPCPSGLSLEETAKWIEERIISNDLKGIGELTFGSHNVANIENIFKYVHESNKKLPIWIHTFNPLVLQDIKEIIDLSHKYKSIKVIMGHGGGENWLETIDMAKTNRNVYIDISASFTTFSIRYIAQELPDRCVFSSDLPYGDPLLGIRQIEYLIKDKTIKENLLGLNTMRLMEI